jgi:hypothetical protein
MGTKTPTAQKEISRRKDQRMITRTEAAAQVERMNGLKFYPRGEDQDAALIELCRAVEGADTIEIAKRVIDDVMHDAIEAPAPAILRTLIWQMNEKHEQPRAAPAPSTNQCSRCQGFGCIGGLAFGPSRLCCPATWCDCSAGNIRRREEPDYVDRVNECREKLLKRFATPPVRTPGMKSVAEEYHGDF